MQLSLDCQEDRLVGSLHFTDGVSGKRRGFEDIAEGEVILSAEVPVTVLVNDIFREGVIEGAEGIAARQGAEVTVQQERRERIATEPDRLFVGLIKDGAVVVLIAGEDEDIVAIEHEANVFGNKSSECHDGKSFLVKE